MKYNLSYTYYKDFTMQIWNDKKGINLQIQNYQNFVCAKPAMVQKFPERKGFKLKPIKLIPNVCKGMQMVTMWGTSKKNPNFKREQNSK